MNAGEVEEVAPRKETAQTKIDETRLSGKGQRIRRYGFALVFFTIPSVAIFCAWLLYKGIRRLFIVPRWILLVLLIANLCVIAMQPVTAIASGPFYLWYVVVNHVVQQLSRGMALGKFLMLHQAYNLLGSSVPFLSAHQVFGTPVNLFFTLPEAVTSSLVWATVYISVRGLFYKSPNRGSKPDVSESQIADYPITESR